MKQDGPEIVRRPSGLVPQSVCPDNGDSQGGLRRFISKLISGENLRREEAAQFLDALLESSATEGQIAGSLVALAAKGETVEELCGMAGAMRAHSKTIRSNHNCFIDTAGTGSSRAKTFNVSTAAAFVIAGAGLPVAKHGNRAASSLTGSADVLTRLGVNINASRDLSEKCLNELGICFMFAPLYHGATARVAAVRRELGIQTTFNLLGPLTNPAGAPRQLVGVWHRELVKPLAFTLAELGTEKSWVVHGEDGLDEVTIADKTFVAEVCEGRVRTLGVAPEDFGLSRASIQHLCGGDAEVNARTVKNVLSGLRKDEARALVIANAASALYIGGLADNLFDAARLAEQSIDTGAANFKLRKLIEMTGEGANEQ